MSNCDGMNPDELLDPSDRAPWEPRVTDQIPADLKKDYELCVRSLLTANGNDKRVIGRIKELIERIATGEAKLREMTKDRDLWLAELAQAREEVEAKNQELRDAYRQIEVSNRLLDLVYVDADGENPNPRTWKDRAEKAEAQLREHQKPVTVAQCAEIGLLSYWDHPQDQAERVTKLIRSRSNPVDGSKGESK